MLRDLSCLDSLRLCCAMLVKVWFSRRISDAQSRIAFRDARIPWLVSWSSFLSWKLSIVKSCSNPEFSKETAKVDNCSFTSLRVPREYSAIRRVSRWCQWTCRAYISTSANPYSPKEVILWSMSFWQYALKPSKTSIEDSRTDRARSIFWRSICKSWTSSKTILYDLSSISPILAKQAFSSLWVWVVDRAMSDLIYQHTKVPSRELRYSIYSLQFVTREEMKITWGITGSRHASPTLYLLSPITCSNLCCIFLGNCDNIQVERRDTVLTFW